MLLWRCRAERAGELKQGDGRTAQHQDAGQRSMAPGDKGPRGGGGSQSTAADWDMPLPTFSSASLRRPAVLDGGPVARGGKAAPGAASRPKARLDWLAWGGEGGQVSGGGRPDVEPHPPALRRAAVLLGRHRAAGLGAGRPGAAGLLAALLLSFLQVPLYLLHPFFFLTTMLAALQAERESRTYLRLPGNQGHADPPTAAVLSLTYKRGFKVVKKSKRRRWNPHGGYLLKTPHFAVAVLRIWNRLR